MKKIVVLLIAFVLAGVSHAQTAENSDKLESEVHINENVIIQVYVTQKGKILINGNSSTLAELDKELEKIKSQNGIVHYSRDIKSNEPPKESMQVMELIVKHELPLKFYTNQSFTTPVKLN